MSTVTFIVDGRRNGSRLPADESFPFGRVGGTLNLDPVSLGCGTKSVFSLASIVPLFRPLRFDVMPFLDDDLDTMSGV